jgi:MOSC domain-containing protein YiiM
VHWALDPANYNDQDATRTLTVLGGAWAMLASGLNPAAMNEGAPSVRSCALETVATLNSLLAEPISAIVEPIQQVELTAHAALRSLGDIGSARDEFNPVFAGVLARWYEAGRAAVAAAGVPHQVGQVRRLSRSNGGVPKLTVDELDVQVTGAAGDRQAARVHHGRPWQALCVWSGEVIDQLAADGHPIRDGAAGENITVEGVDWSTIRPGVEMRIGTMRCSVSAFADPCSKNAQWFSDLDYGRIHWERGHLSRVYTSGLEPGVVRTGDPVVVEGN